jgi:hypothetical protein
MRHCIPVEPLLLVALLVFLSFVLFMLLCRDAIRAIAKRWESRPIWTAKHEIEVRDLMRQWAASE